MFTVSYEILATPDQVAALGGMPDEAAFLETIRGVSSYAFVTGYSPGSFTEPALESAPTAATTPAPTSPVVRTATGGDTVAAAQSDSSATVFILGALGFVVLFVGVLVPTLCKRRCRALLGMKGNGGNAPKQEARLQPEKPRAEISDWDVDKTHDTQDVSERRASSLEEAETGSPSGEPSTASVEGLEALGLSMEECTKMGITSPADDMAL